MSSLDRALHAIEAGLSIKAASEQYGITKSTLQRHSRGSMTRVESAIQRQALAPKQETILLEWISKMEMCGFPPTSSRICSLASAIISRPLHRNWIQRFSKRHPQLLSTRAAGLSQTRASIYPESFEEFYAILEKITSYYKISRENWWNMDETGIHIAESSRNLRVWVQKEGKTAFTIPEKGQLITAIEAISAVGGSTPPYLLSKGSVIPLSHLPNLEFFESKQAFFYGRTKSAFSTQETGLDWLKRAFIPYSKPQNNERRPWRLLLLDGHISHHSNKFIDTAYANRIALLFFPSHATHIIQPLDRVTFGILKAEFHKLVRNRAINGELSITMQAFYEIYFESRIPAIERRNCEAAFRKTGLFPTNISIPLGHPSIRKVQPVEESIPAQRDPGVLTEEAQSAFDIILKQYQELRGPKITREQQNLLRTARSDTARIRAELMIAREENTRLRGENQTLRRAKQSQRRVILDPNSRVISRRQAAHARGLIASSPPPKALELEDLTQMPETPEYSLISDVEENVEPQIHAELTQ
jgi:hypothetical protein